MNKKELKRECKGIIQQKNLSSFSYRNDAIIVLAKAVLEVIQELEVEVERLKEIEDKIINIPVTRS